MPGIVREALPGWTTCIIPDDSPETSFKLSIDPQCPRAQLTDRESIRELVEASLRPYIQVDDVIILRPPIAHGKRSSIWCKVKSESIETLKTVAKSQKNQVHCILSRVWIEFPTVEEAMNRNIMKMDLQYGNSTLTSVNSNQDPENDNPNSQKEKVPITPTSSKIS